MPANEEILSTASTMNEEIVDSARSETDNVNISNPDTTQNTGTQSNRSLSDAPLVRSRRSVMRYYDPDDEDVEEIENGDPTTMITNSKQRQPESLSVPDFDDSFVTLVCQAVEAHPDLGDKKIAEMLQKKLSRKVNRSQVQKIRTRNGIESGKLSKASEVKKAVLQAANSYPGLNDRQMADIIREEQKMWVSTANVRKILRMNGFASPMRTKRIELEDAVLKTAQAHPELSDKGIADLLQEKLKREVKGYTVSTILRKHGVGPVRIQKSTELKNTILETATDNPDMNDREITRVLQEKKEIAITPSHVRDVLRKSGVTNVLVNQRNELRKAVLEIAEENLGLTDREISELVQIKLDRDVSNWTVTKILRKNGIASHYSSRRNEFTEVVLRMAKEHPELSYADIAEKVTGEEIFMFRNKLIIFRTAF